MGREGLERARPGLRERRPSGGTGEGEQVKAQGIEIDEKAIYECVAKGLSVVQQDIETGLSEYLDKSFDYVILAGSLQQVKKPDSVLERGSAGGKEGHRELPQLRSLQGEVADTLRRQGARHTLAPVRVVRHPQPALPQYVQLHRILSEAQHQDREIGLPRSREDTNAAKSQGRDSAFPDVELMAVTAMLRPRARRRP